MSHVRSASSFHLSSRGSLIAQDGISSPVTPEAHHLLEDFRKEMIWKIACYQFDSQYELKHKSKYMYELWLQEVATQDSNGQLKYQHDADQQKERWAFFFNRVTELMWEQSHARHETVPLIPFEPVLECIFAMFQEGGVFRNCADASLRRMDPRVAVTGLCLYAKAELPGLKKQMELALTSADKKQEPPPVLHDKKEETYFSMAQGLFNYAWKQKDQVVNLASTLFFSKPDKIAEVEMKNLK